jgi:beta-lactamase regulating signal transducer with metallopeptidase domain
MMLSPTIIQGPTSILALVADAAVRTLALAGAAGLALVAFRVRSTSARLFTWTAVLYAALAMPLLGWLLPALPVPTPTFVRHDSAQSIAQRTQGVEAIRQTSSLRPLSSASIPRSTKPQTAQLILQTPAESSFRFSVPWTALATVAYLIVAVVLLARFAIGIVLGHRLMHAAQEIKDPRVSQRLSSRALACGLSYVRPAAESALISVPVTMGALRSIILLPVTWREWDDAKLNAVIAHEVSHVARRDALKQRLSLLHRAIFWFSPLAWWLDRHLADLAEQASDEAALSCGADRNDYARTLLGFFEALQASPGRVRWQGVSMAKAGQAEQRVERILAWRGSVTMGLKKSIAVAIIAFAIPAVYLAAAAHPANYNPSSRSMDIAQAQTPANAPAATSSAAPSPESAPAESGLATGVVGGVIGGTVGVGPASPPPPPAAAPAVAPVAGVAAMHPLAPMAPVAPIAPLAGQSYGHGFSYAYGYDDEQRFVIVTGKSDSLTMSGSMEDARHVEKLKKIISGDFIWFQRDEKSYVIRDQATIDRARKLWLPQEELGRKQEALGKQQEALGKKQETLGAKMEQVQVKVPDMTAELDKLRAELKQLSSGATMDQVGQLQSEIGELQSKIGEIQSHAGEQQSKLGEEQGALGEQQGKLGEQQGELGHQQAELAQKAARQMKELLDEAISKGTAQPEPETGKSASL